MRRQQKMYGAPSDWKALRANCIVCTCTVPIRWHTHLIFEWLNAVLFYSVGRRVTLSSLSGAKRAKCFPFSTFHRVVYRYYVAFVRVRPFSNAYIALKAPPSTACKCNHSFGLRSLDITMANGLIGARFTWFSSHCCHALCFPLQFTCISTATP